MLRSVVAIWLLSFFLAVTVMPIRAQVRGVIVGPGAERYPIAVPPLKNLGPAVEGAKFSQGIADTIVRDLDLSGWFRVIDRAAYIEDAQASGITLGAFDFSNWSTLGAEALVKGGFTVYEDNLVAEIRLFDVFQRRQVLGKRYTGRAADYRRIAHKFVDEIVLQFTGVRGIFDTRISYVSTAGGRFKEIFVAHLDGADKVQVTNNRTINLSPSWSSDGRTLLYTSFKDGSPKVYRYDLATGADTLFSARRGLNLGGSWSPDGERIAMALERNGNMDVYLVDRAGKILKRLTSNAGIDVSPSWSPSGAELVFVSNRSGGPQLYIKDIATLKTRRITYSGGYNTSPEWSSKGNKIAYSGLSDGRFNIFTIPPEGGDAQMLTSNAGDNEDPSWSPDGRYLLFSSNRTGSYGIYVMQANGENQRRLTGSSGDDTNPSWSPRLD